MEDDKFRFAFPHYFQTIFKLYSFCLTTPVTCLSNITQDGKWKRVFRVQKSICVALHLMSVLYIFLKGSSLSNINLKKHPTLIFSIANFIVLLTAVVFVLRFVWSKCSTLSEITSQRIRNESSKANQKARALITLLFLLNPICVRITEVAVVVQRCFTLSSALLDSFIWYPLLTEIRLRPHLDNKEEQKAIILEEWERYVAYLVAVVVIYIGMIASVTIWTIFLGALAIHEINSKQIAFLQVARIETAAEEFLKTGNKIRESIQDALKPLMTIVVVGFYANIATELILFGEYGTYDWITPTAKVFTLMIALLANASATAKGRVLSKLILSMDARIQSDDGKIQKYGSADIPSIINLSLTSCTGKIGPVTYGSLGYGLGISVQLSVIMLQFYELEEKDQKTFRWVDLGVSQSDEVA